MTALQRLKKAYESTAAVVQRRARLYAPGLAGRLALATGLLVVLAVAAMSIFAIGALRRLAEAEGLTRVELAVSSAREGMRQSTEDLLTAARILGRASRAATPAARPRARDAAAVSRALLRERGARRLRARARRGLARHDDGRDRVGSRARGSRRAGRAVPDHGRGAEARVVRRASRRRRAPRHHGHRAAQPRRAPRRAAHRANRRADRDRRLRVVRARRRPAGDLEHGRPVARRHRRGLRRRDRLVRRELARRLHERRDDRACSRRGCPSRRSWRRPAT